MACLFGMGCVLMRTDPQRAIESLDESIQLSDTMGIDLSSMPSRSLRAIGSSFVGSTLDALTSTHDALSWAAERGMWSSTLNDFTTAAFVLQRAQRPDVAITLLAAREHSGFARGFGTGRASLVDELRQSNPETFSDCWNRGLRLDPRTATNYALMTIESLLSDMDETASV